MKTARMFLALTLVWLSTVALAAQSAERPNVVLMLADNLG